MTLTGALTVLLFLIPPGYLLFQYRRKPSGQRPGKLETAGIVASAVLMTAALVVMMSLRIFF